MTTLADIRARRSTTTSTWISWARWILVLPAAILFSSIARSFVGGLIAIVISGVLSAPTVGSTVIAIVVPFFEAAVFVMSGSVVAPRAKVQTARILIAFSLLVSLLALIFYWSGAEIPWLTINLRTPDAAWVIALGTVSGLAGLFFGLHWVRRDAARTAL